MRFVLIRNSLFFYPHLNQLQWSSFPSAHQPSPATIAYIAANGPTIRTFLNMGVVFGSIATAAVAIGAADASLVTAVKAINTATADGKCFLCGNGSGPGALDIFVMASLVESFTLLFPPAAVVNTYPAYSAWATATLASIPITRATTAVGISSGGRSREGGQVDLRADCVRVSTAADVSIARNAGHKKAASQRDAENSKKDDSVAGAGAEAVPSSAAPKSGAKVVAAAAAAIVNAANASPNGASVQPASNKILPTLSHAERLEKGIAVLVAHNVAHGKVHSHPPALTAADLATALVGITGVRIKNLFLKAKKPRTGVPNDSKLWLVIARSDAATDLNKIGTKLGYAKDGIRFADADTLIDNLGVAQGHVSPIALANDEMCVINILIDASLTSETAVEPLLFHPFTNESSVEMTYKSLVDLITKTGHAAATIMDFFAA